MKTIPQVYKALAGIFCLLIGGALVFVSGRRYSEKRYIVDAASCRMQVLAIERKDLPSAAELGSVVLFHGISANNIIMQYDHATAGRLNCIAHPVTFIEDERSAGLPPPMLGQHTDEILREMGLSTKAIEELHREQVVS